MIFKRENTAWVLILIIIATIFSLSYVFYELSFYKLKEINKKELTISTSELLKIINMDINLRIRDIDALSSNVLGSKNEIILNDNFRNELLGLAIFKKNDINYSVVSNYKNSQLFKRSLIDENLLSTIYEKHKLPLDHFFQINGVILLNRSIRQDLSSINSLVPIITFMVPITSKSNNDEKLLAAADLSMNFLINDLKKVKNIEALILNTGKKLLASTDIATTVEFSNKDFVHPAINYLGKDIKYQEMEDFIFTISPIGYGSLFLICQIKSKKLSDLPLVFRENLWMLVFPLSILLLLFAIGFIILKKFKSFFSSKNINGKKLSNSYIPTRFPDQFKKLSEQFLILKKAFLNKEEQESKEIQTLTNSILRAQNLKNLTKYTNYNILSYRKEEGSAFWFHKDNNLKSIFGVGSIYSNLKNINLEQAILAMFLSTLNRVIGRHLFCLNEILDYLNEVLFVCFNGEFCLSMTIGEFDLNDNTFSYFVSGGFPPFFDKTNEALTKSGKMLGENRKIELEIKKIKVEETLFLLHEVSLSSSFNKTDKIQKLFENPENEHTFNELKKIIESDFSIVFVRLKSNVIKSSFPKECQAFEFKTILNDMERREELLYGDHWLYQKKKVQ